MTIKTRGRNFDAFGTSRCDATIRRLSETTRTRADRDHHRLAFIGEPLDQFVDLDDGADIDAARRFIEK